VTKVKKDARTGLTGPQPSFLATSVPMGTVLAVCALIGVIGFASGRITAGDAAAPAASSAPVAADQRQPPSPPAAGTTSPEAPTPGAQNPTTEGCSEVRNLVDAAAWEDAIAKFDGCAEGPEKEALLKAIDDGVLKLFQAKGCETKPIIAAASRIRAGSARVPWAEKCGGQ
jgi:hypothetical protein